MFQGWWNAKQKKVFLEPKLHKFLLQVSYYGNATSDLCYLIYSSTTALFRRKHLQKLLKFYFDTLVESIESFGIQNKVDGRLKFDFDQLLLEFKQVFSGILWGLMQTWANNSTGNHYLSKTRQLAYNLCMNRWH